MLGTPTTTLAVSETINPIVDSYFVPVIQEYQPLCSIASVAEDRCGRLWILDSGLKDLTTLKCTPKIVIINKQTKQVLHNFEFPPEYYQPTTRLFAIVVDESFLRCRDFKAIASDALKNHLVVYEPGRRRSWLVTSPTFQNQSIFENVQFQDVTLNFALGIYSIALTPPYGWKRDRLLVFTIFSGNQIYAVPTSILYDYRLWTRGFSAVKQISSERHFFSNLANRFLNGPKYVEVQRFFYFLATTDVQLIGQCGIDRKWRMYCGTVGGITVMNLRNRSNGNSFIVRNDTFEFITAVNIVRNPQGEEELFALDNSLLVGFVDSTLLNILYY